MKKLVILLLIIPLVSFGQKIEYNLNNIGSFLNRYDGTSWTNGFSTYSFSENCCNVDFDFSSCEPCFPPTTECHMCGYTWMKNDADSFTYGSDYQNDFYYEKDSNRFYEDNNNTIWSVHSRQGFIEPYESGKIKWVPVDSNSSEIEKIRLKNKPLLDSFELKQKEEIEAIEKEFY
tara:strand:+ start:473 stop:997 length:525 start_codon:yes stop_codon:yes gene_type:complete